MNRYSRTTPTGLQTSRAWRRSARPCRFVFVLPLESGAWVMAVTVLRERLAEQRNGVKLHTI
eukprot:5007178-Prymnesium_polylepis.1